MDELRGNLKPSFWCHKSNECANKNEKTEERDQIYSSVAERIPILIYSNYHGTKLALEWFLNSYNMNWIHSKSRHTCRLWRCRFKFLKQYEGFCKDIKSC